ncbi:hypothetical protein JZU61_04515 [bacterium]|jgi:hypothetical protein|nr:hypothetical protein [bacterium]
MKIISILTKDYYDRPEYYAFMPPSIFNALEEAELRGAINGQDVAADVPEEDFLKMIDDYTNHKNNLTDGS